MADRLDTAQRRRLMQKVNTKNTGPEKAVRSLLHKLGFRFRLHRKDLPGTPDIVFPRRKIALFVHGCYWHAHGCSKGQPPKSRLDYWAPKLEANKERDKRNVDLLRDIGWKTEVIWQCDLKDEEKLKERIIKLLS